MPFVYGKIAGDMEFTNRTKDTAHLIQNFEAGINTILISPRRWGKSSLVAHVSKALVRKNKKIKVCHLDLFSIRSEEEFYEQYASAVLSASNNKLQDAINDAKLFLSKFIPRLSFSPDAVNEISIGLDWKEVKNNPTDILNLPEAIAKKKNIKMVVCIDEFQNMAEFSDSLNFQKKLRSAIQKHKHVSYCFYGSKRHMMMHVFTSPSMPFYKFGDIVFLEKLTSEDLSKFVQKRFAATGKSISPADAELIAALTECHPYYAQQLAQQTWLQTSRKANRAIVLESHDRISNQLSLLFQSITDGLPSTYVNFLKAILQGEKQLSSKKTIEEYQLGTSANVIKIRKALEDREIIDLMGGQIQFLDPYYAYWLKTKYFR